MISRLERIRADKQAEVELLRKRSLSIRNLSKRPSFRNALLCNPFTLIAEIKRVSPSIGRLNAIVDPTVLAKEYIDCGASAISVLTDGPLFSGSIDDLQKIATASPITPILRKDFIIDRLQIEEAAIAGASAVLLIVRFLGAELKSYLQICRQLSLDALVEVHDEEELHIAIEAGADIIGVNNRDLESFEVSLSIAERLAPLIPNHIVSIAESGICSGADALRVRACGYNAVLVGGALVKSDNRKRLIHEILRGSSGEN